MLTRYASKQDFSIAANGSLSVYVEDYLNEESILFPKLIIANWSSDTDTVLSYTLTQYTDLGTSSLPEDSGTSTVEVADVASVGNRTLSHVHLHDYTSFLHSVRTVSSDNPVAIYHKLDMTNLSLSYTMIVQLFIIGIVESISDSE